MKAKEEEDFQHFDVEAIRHFNICDCLDLFRKIQFLDAIKTRNHEKIEASLEARIITLVMPGNGPFPARKLRSRTS
jgi:hypothetical protein